MGAEALFLKTGNRTFFESITNKGKDVDGKSRVLGVGAPLRRPGRTRAKRSGSRS